MHVLLLLLLVNYAELWDWSVKNYANFWEDFFHFSGIKHSQPYDEVNTTIIIIIIIIIIINLIVR